MPASRIKVFRVPVVSLLLLLLLYTPLVACNSKDALPSSAAANADDYPLLNDGSVSLSISPSQKSNSICLEVPSDDFSFIAIRPSCAETNLVVYFSFGDDECKMRFEWSSKDFGLLRKDFSDGFMEPIRTEKDQTVSLKGGQASFQNEEGVHRQVSSCPIKKEEVKKGKNVVRFSIEALSNIGCSVEVKFPSAYKVYEKPVPGIDESPDATPANDEKPSPESNERSSESTKATSKPKPRSAAIGLWIGIGCGVVAICCVAGSLIFCLLRYRRRRRTVSDGPDKVVVEEVERNKKVDEPNKSAEIKQKTVEQLSVAIKLAKERDDQLPSASSTTTRSARSTNIHLPTSGKFPDPEGVSMWKRKQNEGLKLNAADIYHKEIYEAKEHLEKNPMAIREYKLMRRAAQKNYWPRKMQEAFMKTEELSALNQKPKQKPPKSIAKVPSKQSSVQLSKTISKSVSTQPSKSGQIS